ncbi:hypothetical protein Trydic_g18068 [Trypoxylus dichotomus]
MRDKLIKVLCYADDATPFADSEDGLQRLLQTFTIEAQKVNMEILTAKTKNIAREYRNNRADSHDLTLWKPEGACKAADE